MLSFVSNFYNIILKKRKKYHLKQKELSIYTSGSLFISDISNGACWGNCGRAVSATMELLPHDMQQKSCNNPNWLSSHAKNRLNKV